MLKIIKDLLEFSPRQFEGEDRAREYIEKFLGKIGVSFSVQEFEVGIPRAKKWELKVDGKLIECLPCSFVSGRISANYVLSEPFKDNDSSGSVIVYNPKSDAICLHTFHSSPAVAVSRKDIEKIKNAKKIEGFVEVDEKKRMSANILAGNIENPKNIIFTHYDSIQKGAVDNASGVAVCLDYVKNNDIENSLFVISGNEELSYDEYRYWGFGYRVFQDEYEDLMDNAKNIVIVDSAGNAKTEVMDGSHELVTEGFPINNLEKYKNKISFIAGGFDELLRYYHSDLDDGSDIREEFLEETLRRLNGLIGK